MFLSLDTLYKNHYSKYNVSTKFWSAVLTLVALSFNKRYEYIVRAEVPQI